MKKGSARSAAVAEQLRALAPGERPYLVSALATLAKDRPGDGEWALVALLSPHDADLRRRVGEALGMKVRFYLADPSAVEAAVESLHPADTKA